MKSEKGITLTSLAIYIVVTLIVLAILATISGNFQSNVRQMYSEGTNNYEIDKFNVYFLKEVKKKGNEIDTLEQQNEIEFISGNKYTFSANDKCIYLNNSIKVAENIASCTFSSNIAEKEDDEKTVITVTIQAIDAEQKQIEYVLNSDEIAVNEEDEEDYIYIPPVLPAEYQQVEYIESTGTQYIDTGIYSKNETSIDLTIKLNTSTTDQKFLGSYGNGGICLGTYLGKWRIGGNQWGGTSSVGYGLCDIATTTEKTNIKAYGTTWIINDVTASSTTSISGNNQAHIAVFAINFHGNILQKDSIKLYNLKIYDNDILVRDFIPCYRKSDEEIGLYDTVNDVFYTKQGTGDFIAGPNV